MLTPCFVASQNIVANSSTSYRSGLAYQYRAIPIYWAISVLKIPITRWPEDGPSVVQHVPLQKYWLKANMGYQYKLADMPSLVHT